MTDKIDRDVIAEKQRELARCLNELNSLKSISYEEYTGSLAKQWMIFYGLQQAIQHLIDVGNHILAGIGENQIESYADVVDRLGEKGIIPMDFSKQIRGMVGLRNILVHEYARLDLKMIYEVLQNRLSDFEDFQTYVRQYLSNK